MTKYYCDFCKQEVTEDVCYASIRHIIGLKGVHNVEVHAHKKCFVDFIGAEVCENAEKEYEKLKAERLAKRKGTWND